MRRKPLTRGARGSRRSGGGSRLDSVGRAALGDASYQGKQNKLNSLELHGSAIYLLYKPSG